MTGEQRVTLADELLPESKLGSRLQDLVEEASRELGRPVAIDDRHLRLLAYTRHAPEELDRVRQISILEKRTPSDVLAWLDQHGAPGAQTPVTVPANPELGFDARICAPIRCHEHLLGYLWLIDRDGSLSGPDLERAGRLADEAGVILYRELLLRDLDRSRERELLRDILSDEETLRRQATAQLAEYDLFVADGPVAAIVAPVTSPADGGLPESARLAIDASLARARRQLSAKHSLHLLRPDHALLVVSLADPVLRAGGATQFASRVRVELMSAGEGAGSVVAIGGAVPSVTEIRSSYGQARRVLTVAAAHGGFGDVVSWEELGIYQLLSELSPEALDLRSLHPGLRSLIENPRTQFLVATLECYLAHAGDTQATAATLYLHRTSLYRRLRRIEQITRASLSDGEDCLVLHVGLKLARLLGMSWSAHAAEGDTAVA